jgi:hypothetical protein
MPDGAYTHPWEGAGGLLGQADGNSYITPLGNTPFFSLLTYNNNSMETWNNIINSIA